MPSGARGRPIQVAVLGVSLSPNCGVRDHALVLAGELESAGISCSVHWLLRSERSLRGSRREVAAWVGELAGELSRARPDVILLHYSVFTVSHRGVPLFVPSLLAALRRSGAPIVTVMHEFAYPWELGGWRGKVWAVTQRAMLIELLRVSSATIVTAGSRKRWLEARPWLPRREVAVAPVFSNLPPPLSSGRAPHDVPLVGLFGYSYQGAAVSLVLDAVEELCDRAAPVHLILLGAPGPSSPAGEEWLSAARARGLADVVSFTGPLSAQALSDSLAACDVLLFADVSGPTSRKGTLAGSLGSGRPVVAIDGPLTWRELAEARAVALAAPNARGLAHVLAELLGDAAELQALGARGRSFYEREMEVGRTVQCARRLIDEAASSRGRGWR